MKFNKLYDLIDQIDKRKQNYFKLNNDRMDKLNEILFNQTKLNKEMF